MALQCQNFPTVTWYSIYLKKYYKDDQIIPSWPLINREPNIKLKEYMRPQSETHVRIITITQKEELKITYSNREIDQINLKISPQESHRWTSIFNEKITCSHNLEKVERTLKKKFLKKWNVFLSNEIYL